MSEENKDRQKNDERNKKAHEWWHTGGRGINGEVAYRFGYDAGYADSQSSKARTPDSSNDVVLSEIGRLLDAENNPENKLTKEAQDLINRAQELSRYKNFSAHLAGELNRLCKDLKKFQEKISPECFIHLVMQKERKVKNEPTP